WAVTSKLGLDSYDEHDQPNLGNPETNWSEREVYLQGLFHYDTKRRVKISTGFECSYEHFGPGWNGDEKSFKLSQMVSDESSDSYSASRILVGNGWETTQFALLGEGNFAFTPAWSMLLSGRVDKHVYTDYMFSPRAALIWNIVNAHYLKFVYQRSVRMTTAYDTYIAQKDNFSADEETLDTYELIYEGQVDRLGYHVGAFYNELDAIGWTDQGTSSLGNLKAAGLEVETDYRTDTVRLGFNHGYTKQLDWAMGAGVERSGISYSDYNYDAGGGTMLTDNGNDLSNWSNHITKFFADITFLKDKLTLHGDAHIFWGFEGYRDGLDVIEDASGGGDIFNDFSSHDVYDTLITANLQLTWHITNKANLAAFVHNIPLFGDNKRYYYSTGYTKAYPERGWQEQPTVFGVKGTLQF
ncbi:TonB-dependent receptor domain-containing protein, partial [Planctomycetota bacterium]